ncbi:MAG: ribonuclease Z [Candidatus Wallbacteria bacterium]|nr:ribonuclease Z [Candidatus Wallbacteria bacterium]
MKRIQLVPRLVNKKDADPGLLVELQGLGRYYLFDLGANERISKHELLRTSHVFVSHTHIDHFVGFDRLLRHSLGERRDVHVFGPAGLLGNLEGKFAGYLWNLQEAGPTFVGHEIDGRTMRTRRYPGEHQFRGAELREEGLAADGAISTEEGVTVRCAALEHGITTLGYCVSTAPFPAIRSEALARLGLSEGPWLAELKSAALAGAAAGATLVACGREHSLPELVRELVEMKSGDRIAYVTDTLFNERTLESIAELARDATVLFCEANFRDEDVERAKATSHLTASQAARFAAAAGVEKLVLFHISRKYEGDFGPSFEQARAVFGAVE